MNRADLIAELEIERVETEFIAVKALTRIRGIRRATRSTPRWSCAQGRSCASGED